MSTIIQQKKELRQKIKLIKQQQTETDKTTQSALIFQQVEQLNLFQNAEVVMLYWSMADEVQTHNFIEKWWQQKTILLPVVDGNTLKIKQYTGFNSMIRGEQFGILEPTGNEFNDLDKIDMIIVPGVAFDKHNNRLGRGRGFYDKLLATTNALKLGVCFNFQVVDHVPTEEFDFKMDEVISTKKR